MNTTIILSTLLLGQFQYGNPLPTYEDHLVAPPGEKRVSLIMDVSGSMLDGATPHPTCAYAETLFGTRILNKNQQMIAAAVGCQTGNDGFLDLWADRMHFAITGFGYNWATFVPTYSAPGTITGPHYNVNAYVKLVQDFTRDKAALEAAIIGLPAEGGTPLEWGLITGSYQHQRYWTNSVPGTYKCDQHFNILMTDGIPVPYYSRPLYNWAKCEAPTVLPVDWTNPAAVAEWVYDPPGGTEWDSVCNLDGKQTISTYTIGFGDSWTLDEALLRDVADAGGGIYLHAQNSYQLAAQFGRILNSIVARSARITSPSFQSNGLQLGNLAFSASLLPQSGQPWVGNLKSYCIYPPKHTNGQYYLEHEVGGSDCLYRFRDPDGAGPLPAVPVISTTPTDRFTGSNSAETTVGGVGEVLFRSGAPRNGPLAGGTPGGAVPFGSDHYRRRKILTWTDTSGYKEVADITDLQMFAWGCARTKVLAYLHGYDPTNVDCATGTPTRFGTWPIAAGVATQPTILRWAADCEANRNACLVAANLDDGGVHFFDTSDGYEHGAVIPKQMFRPGYVGNYPIATILDQPTAELNRRPFNDGGMIRLHDDYDGDGIIDPSEPAYLIWGLGHGGAGYYIMDVSKPFSLVSGVGGAQHLLPDSDNPIYTLLASPGATFARDLRNLFARPWIGRARFTANGNPQLTIGIGSGQAWYMDRPGAPVKLPLLTLREPFDPSAAGTVLCFDFAVANGYTAATADSAFCSAMANPAYQFMFGGAAGDFVINTPLWYTQGLGPDAMPAGAVGEFTFSLFDLEEGDYLVFQDLSGNELSPRYTGNQTGGGGTFTMPVWITTRPFVIKVHIDNLQPRTAQGIRFHSFKWIPDRLLGGCAGGNPCILCDIDQNGVCQASPQECNPHAPPTQRAACNRCDTDGNGVCQRPECREPAIGVGGSACQFDHSPFVALLGVDLLDDDGPFTDSTDNGAVRRIFTETCRGTYPNGVCYDKTSIPDLRYMLCPITAEVRAYEEGDIARSWYVGDLCGQMWKFWTDDGGGTYKAKRLFLVNNFVNDAISRDYRRFERPVDIAISTCTNSRSVAVYWGTGNMSRPGATDNLEGRTGDRVSRFTSATGRGQVTNRNIAGVFFDRGQWDTGNSRDLANFENLTPTNFTNSVIPTFSKTGDGWFFAFREDEQMLRDPLVFEGVFYVKTNTALTAAVPCETATTIDRVYATQNCTGDAVVDPNGNGAREAGDREVASGNEDIGGNIIAYAPPDGTTPLIAMGGGLDGANANIAPNNPNRRALQMYLWWRTQ